MKLPSIVLLLTAAAISCGFDYSITWAQPLPETIAPWTWVTPIIRLKTVVGGGPETLRVKLNYNGQYLQYSETCGVRPPAPGDSASITFPEHSLGHGDTAYLLGFALGPDSNPHNDTVYHRFWIYTPGIDVGIRWASPLPETIPEDTSLRLTAIVTNYTSPTASFSVCMVVYIESVCGYNQVVPVPYLPGGASMPVCFPEFIMWEPCHMSIGCWLQIEGDTNPSNDTIWWRPYVRAGLEEQPAAVRTPSGLRVAPNPFSSAVALEAPSAVLVTIRDAGGRVLRKLRTDPNGHALWDGRDSRDAVVPRGVYFCAYESASQRLQTRVIKVE